MSEASLDGNFYVSFGLVISVRQADVETVRAAVLNCGGMIVFQTVSDDPLYLLRRNQVEKILNGDTSQLRGVHKKKQEQRRVDTN
jgi:hypothetical protein